MCTLDLLVFEKGVAFKKVLIHTLEVLIWIQMCTAPVTDIKLR